MAIFARRGVTTFKRKCSICKNRREYLEGEDGWDGLWFCHSCDTVDGLSPTLTNTQRLSRYSTTTDVLSSADKVLGDVSDALSTTTQSPPLP